MLAGDKGAGRGLTRISYGPDIAARKAAYQDIWLPCDGMNSAFKRHSGAVYGCLTPRVGVVERIGRQLMTGRALTIHAATILS